MSNSNFNEAGFINRPEAVRSNSVKELMVEEIMAIEKLLTTRGIRSCAPFLEGCMLFNRTSFLTLKEIGYISNKFEEARGIIASL